jgi:U3 small nucleolar RNA-associated protein 22
MVVVMPQSIFQEKDFLNYRYFYKRAYYLACIAAGIQEGASDRFESSFEYLNGNSLHPILIIKPKAGERVDLQGSPQANFQVDKHRSKTEIHIIPAAPSKLFPESKLRPVKNSVRPRHSSETDSNTLGASPFYNASLRSDCNLELYLQLLHSASKLSTGFKDACVLGRIWLRQRGFGSSIFKGGFGHFEWAALTALLLKGGGPKGHSILSPGYSSYQIFRAIVQFLATSDLANKPQSYEKPDFVPSKSDSPMFYDGPRGQNILYKMSPWSYAILREEAKTAIDMLDDPAFDQFESTFIVQTALPLHRFDCLVHVPIPAQDGEEYSCDHHMPQTNGFSSRIFQILREGLTDRVKLIDIKSTESPSWPVESSCPILQEDSLLVAFIFDPANIDRLVDHGPSAEEKKKAAKYRKFWGDKAELRRFKDGSILESLVWSPGSFYSIFQNILTYLVTHHFSTEVSQGLKFTGEGFEKLLPGSGTGRKTFEALRQAFNDFEKDIRGLESLPLQLRQLSAVSPQLRYSSVGTPSFDPRQPLKEPADVLIQFEGSGRWPDDIIAIQRTKIAFLLKIGSLLQEANDGTTSRLGLENEDHSFQNSAFLDIIYQSGAVFRLRIHHDREDTLLRRQVKEKTTDHLTREDASHALAAYERNFHHLPLHTQSIATHCTRFPLLSPAIRLTKTWFGRHMLSGHVSEELIELLVAHTFLQPFPWRAPSSAMTGFLRTLHFISRWDWRITPLIVDFNGTMTSKEVASINNRLEAWRKIDPAMNRTVVFAASNHDVTGTAFTNEGPSRVAAARMTALARSACKLVKDQGLDLNPKSLFAFSTNDYDIVIHLSPKLSEQTEKKESGKQRFKNLEIQSDLDLTPIGYQPVQMYLDDLQKLYGSSVVFFHSAGLPIAGLWNPQFLQPRKFKINLMYATTKAVGGEEEIKLDKSAILSEIARLGGDMVSRIEVNR